MVRKSAHTPRAENSSASRGGEDANVVEATLADIAWKATTKLRMFRDRLITNLPSIQVKTEIALINCVSSIPNKDLRVFKSVALSGFLQAEDATTQRSLDAMCVDYVITDTDHVPLVAIVCEHPPRLVGGLFTQSYNASAGQRRRTVLQWGGIHSLEIGEGINTEHLQRVLKRLLPVHYPAKRATSRLVRRSKSQNSKFFTKRTLDTFETPDEQSGMIAAR